MRQIVSIVAALLMLASGSASAAMFKCTDAKGKVSFQQLPCPQTSNTQKLATSGPAWVTIKSETTHDGSHIDTLLDTGQVKAFGPLKRVNFKDVTRTFEGSKPVSSSGGIYYHYYDCSGGKVSGPVPELWKGKFEQDYLAGKQDGLLPFETYSAMSHQPQGTAEVVAKVCGD